MENNTTILESLYYVVGIGVKGKDTLIEWYSEALRNGEYLNRSFEDWLDDKFSYDTWTLPAYMNELRELIQAPSTDGFELSVWVRQLPAIQNQINEKWHISAEDFYDWLENLWTKTK